MSRRITPLLVSAVTVLALLAFALPAAAASPEAAVDPLSGSGWVLVEVDGQEVPADAITLVFAGGGASGSSGCNQYNGPYAVVGDSLTFGELATTKVACAEPEASLETAYLAALAQVATWSMADAASLTLAGATGLPELVFAAPGDAGPAGTPAADPLSGTIWRLERLGDEDVPPEVEVTLSFADGLAFGSSGCNQYTGPYSVDGQGLTFGQLASTAMACGEPASSVEATYLAALGQVTGWAVPQDAPMGVQLTLSGPDAGTSLVFGPPAGGS